jgi:predicted outer membrane protein
VATPYSPAPSGPEQSSAGRYDFFLEPKKAPKKSLLPMSGSGSGTSSLLKWFIIVIISMFVLAGLIFAISNGGKDKTPVLTSLAKSQQLIINTSNAGLETLDSRSLYNFATTAKVTTISDQREVLALIKESGGKVDSKLLAKYTDPQVDQALDAAQAAGTYDTTYHTTMQSILKDYQAQLQQIYDTSPSARQHKIAEKNLESVQLLLQMLSQ